MHISITKTTYKGKTHRCTLLRETYVDKHGKRQKHTLGNLSKADPRMIELIKGHLAGIDYMEVNQAFEITQSRIHGPAMAVLKAFEKLHFQHLIGSTASRERDLVCAMVAARIVRPQTKLSTTRWWDTTTFAEHFNVVDAKVDELYGAMDWLLTRQNRIQGKLAKRHLNDGDLVLYDLSSSYFEGECCALARYGYNREKKRGKLQQVNYGLLCDRLGRPVSISVHPGNVSDTVTLTAELRRLQRRFALSKVVVVGDRGMIATAQIEALRQYTDFKWISALKSQTIRKLMRDGMIDAGDTTSLVEVHHPQFPNERLLVCRNAALAKRRLHKREALLEATEVLLDEIGEAVRQKRLQGGAQIGVKLGQVIGRYKMKKHFVWKIDDTSFTYHRNEHSIADEAKLDGVYVIRTSVSAQDMSAPECVRAYKSLCGVERAFRTIKTMHLKVRPIHHWRSDRVRAHLFICMLAYYVQWHMREAWRPLTFADPNLRDDAQVRDPVAAAKRSSDALRKVHTGLLEDGTPAHSFDTLLDNLATIVRNQCRVPGTAASFQMDTQATDWQKKALGLLDDIAQLRTSANA